MLIENEFRVAAPVEETYRLMVDVQRVAPCIPGAEILGQRDEGGYDARATVKLGPLSVSYRGAAEIVEQDALEGRCCVRRVQNKRVRALRRQCSQCKWTPTPRVVTSGSRPISR